MLLYQILAFTMHGKNIKQSYKNNKFKISTPTWNDKFEMSDGSSISGCFFASFKKGNKYLTDDISFLVISVI